MGKVIRSLVLNLLRRKSTQVTLLLTFVGIGVFATLSYQNFFYLQAQNIDQLSVFNEILKPLSGLVLVAQILIIIIASSQLMPNFHERGQQGLVLNSPLSNTSIAVALVSSVFILSLLPHAYFILISFCFYLSSDLDGWLLTTTSVVLIAGSLLYGFVSVAVSLFFEKTLTAMIFVIGAMLLLFGVDELLRSSAINLPISIYLDLFLHLRSGLIDLPEIFFALSWMLFFFALLIFAMQRLRHSKSRSGMVLVFSSLVLLVANGIFGSSDSKQRWDISRGKLHSFKSHIADQISDLKAPILVTAVINDEANHDEIRQAFEAIKQYNENSLLEFTSHQALAANSQISDQFVTLKIGTQQQTIRYPFDRPAKETLAQMVIHLTSRADQWLTFVEGHGEASPFGKTNRDIGLFYHSLKELGWPIALQNLTKQNFISKNTRVLILAASKTKWLPREIDTVISYLEKGGNLLVLREQNDSLPQEIQNYLSIKSNKGILIDWQGYQSGTPHPAILIVNQFTSHVANTNINSLLAFPWSVGIELDEENRNIDNEYQTILKSHRGVWNEFNSGEKELSFNQEIGEQQKGFNLAFSVENNKLNQRIIVVGDSSFLSDSAINNYANRQFSLNLISWLTAQNIEASGDQHKDDFIRTTPITHFLYNWLFSLILPLLFLLVILLLQFRKTKQISNESEK